MLLFTFWTVGTGTLGIPYAISQGGYASVFAMVFVALLTNYTGKLVVDCLYAKQRGVKVRVRQGYADLGKYNSNCVVTMAALYKNNRTLCHGNCARTIGIV